MVGSPRFELGSPALSPDALGPDRQVIRPITLSRQDRPGYPTTPTEFHVVR